MQRDFGALRLSVFSDGLIELPLGQPFYVGEGGVTEAEVLAGLNDGSATFGQNVLLVDSPRSGRTLVDAGVGRHQLLDSRRFGPESGRLATALVEEGVDPASVDRILITHLHPDHCWGLIRPDGSAAFENATVHLHHDELAHWTRLADIDATTPDVDTLRHLGALLAVRPYRERLITFDRVALVAEDITAVPRVGHTPGHTTYRFDTEEGALLSWGDTFHHLAQVAHPTIRARTDTGEGSAPQRSALLDELSASAALVHAYHLPFPGLGTVQRADSMFRWKPLAD